jgi:hypothetical protein
MDQGFCNVAIYCPMQKLQFKSHPENSALAECSLSNPRANSFLGYIALGVASQRK